MLSVYTVTAAADSLSVSTSTVRRIADEFSAYLPDYRPIPGQPRTLSDADVRTIAAILARVNSTPGLTRAQLLTELSAPGSEPLIIPAELPTKAPSTAQESPRERVESIATQTDVRTTERALQAVSDVRRIVEPLSALPAAVDSLHARIAALESQEEASAPPARPDSVQLLSAAVAVGVLIGALVAAAVWDNSAAVVVCVAVALVAVLLSIIAPLRTRG